MEARNVDWRVEDLARVCADVTGSTHVHQVCKGRHRRPAKKLGKVVVRRGVEVAVGPKSTIYQISMHYLRVRVQGAGNLVPSKHELASMADNRIADLGCRTGWIEAEGLIDELL